MDQWEFKALGDGPPGLEHVVIGEMKGAEEAENERRQGLRESRGESLFHMVRA